MNFFIRYDLGQSLDRAFDFDRKTNRAPSMKYTVIALDNCIILQCAIMIAVHASLHGLEKYTNMNIFYKLLSVECSRNHKDFLSLPLN